MRTAPNYYYVEKPFVVATAKGMSVKEALSNTATKEVGRQLFNKSSTDSSPPERMERNSCERGKDRGTRCQRASYPEKERRDSRETEIEKPGRSENEEEKENLFVSGRSSEYE